MVDSKEMNDRIKAIIKFIELVGIEETANFIVNQNLAIDGLQKNNQSFVDAYKMALKNKVPPEMDSYKEVKLKEFEDKFRCGCGDGKTCKGVDGKWDLKHVADFISSLITETENETINRCNKVCKDSLSKTNYYIINQQLSKLKE